MGNKWDETELVPPRNQQPSITFDVTWRDELRIVPFLINLDDPSGSASFEHGIFREARD
jgi:hypothetical protein